jgi:tripartite-type tricarboxylate transporter receptor subunit TctC
MKMAEANMKRTLRWLVVAVCTAGCPVAAAQSFPVKPIRMIAPSSPGGPVDVLARILAQGMTETLGQQMVVENRAGAAGQIGADMVAKSAPDGYTLLLGFSGPLAISPNMNEKTPYDSTRDFAPVSLVAAAPYVLLVHPTVPAKSVKELIALARARPGKMNFASGGNGTGLHMAGELLNFTAGIKIVHVPYKGAGPGIAAMMGGEVDMMFNGVAAALPHIKSGRVRAIAVGGDKRSPLVPELPTIAESGLKFNTTGWYGVIAPRGVPQPVVAKLHAETVKALNLPAVKDQLVKLGVDSVGSTPDQFATLIREELATWGKVIRAAGLKGAPM